MISSPKTGVRPLAMAFLRQWVLSLRDLDERALFWDAYKC